MGYCRAGFEPELAAEFTERAARAGISGYAQTERGSAYVIFHSEEARELDRAMPWRHLIFARQKLRLLAELRDLNAQDRITPLLDALNNSSALSSNTFGSLLVEYPDHDAAKPLAGLARAFSNALRPRLRKAGILSAQDNAELPRLHVCFLAGDHILLATSLPLDSAPWFLGIPRLRMHADAPSRSALKLEEALLTLLDTEQCERLLKPGMRAVDLGAAPGGWTWVLTRHGLHVTAIDNGALRDHVAEHSFVEHVRADGFSWHPKQPMDWMVCDMVEQPRRVADRMGQWFCEGWCRHAIFNLKLPMKKRWQETVQCLQLFEAACGMPVTVSARQLYHDREEITIFASRNLR